MGISHFGDGFQHQIKINWGSMRVIHSVARVDQPECEAANGMAFSTDSTPSFLCSSLPSRQG